VRYLKPALWNILRDRKSNNIIVAVLLGFSATTVTSYLFFTWGSGAGGPSWWSMNWRYFAGFGVALVVAELITRIPKD